MAPSTLSIGFTQNQYNTYRWLREDITDVTDWDAIMEWRLTPNSDEGSALLTLTPGSGLTMTADVNGLVVDIVLTEAQSDALVDAAAAEGATTLYASLKLTTDAGVTEQQFIGAFGIVTTPTE